MGLFTLFIVSLGRSRYWGSIVFIISLVVQDTGVLLNLSFPLVVQDSGVLLYLSFFYGVYDSGVVLY